MPMGYDNRYDARCPDNSFWMALLLVPVLWLLASCEDRSSSQQGPKYEDAPNSEKQVYGFAVHPLHNPRKLTEAYQPLIDYLNRHLTGVMLSLEASRDFSVYEERIRTGTADFLLPNPWQTLQAMEHGYSVVAMVGDAKDFKGVIIVRKDSAIKTPADLRGKAVSYPSPTALAACIMPQFYLHQNGVDINRDIENLYVGSQASSMMSVLLEESAAGAAWIASWRAFQKHRPQEASQLKAIWETEPLLNNSIMARNDVPAELTEKIQTLLIDLKENAEGRKILARLGAAQIHSADNNSYGPVRTFIQRFEQQVRPVKMKKNDSVH